MEEIKSCDYLVIGGGISGLLATYLLRKAKCDVLLASPFDSIGGCIKSLKSEGFTMELGANTFSTNPFFESLIQELNLQGEMRFPAILPFRQFVWHKDRMHELPKGPGALLKSSLFGVSEKFALMRGLFRRGAFSEDVTVGDALSSIFSRSIVEKVVDPALRGIFGGDVWALKLKAIFSGLGSHLIQGGTLISYFKTLKKGRKVFCFNGGNRTLTDVLFSKIQGDFLDEFVSNVSFSSPYQFEVRTKSGLLIRSKNVLIASSGTSSGRFLRDLSNSLSDTLTQLRYAPVTSVHVSCEPSSIIPSGGFGVLFPSNSASRIMGILFNSALFPHVAPNGRSLLTICLGGVHQPAVASLEDRELTNIVLEELMERFPVSDPKILSIYRWKCAIPQYDERFNVLIHSLKEAEATFPGLHFIGVDTGGVGVPERIKLVSELVHNRFFPRSDT